MLQSHDHHVKEDVCLTRPPYRNGKKSRAVKVYTIAQESKYLLVQNIPSIAGVSEQLLPHFNQYGTIEQFWKLDGYERKDIRDDDQFLDTMLIKYVQISRARLAKCRLDDMNFMGSSLHVCYAPECENLDDLREKIHDRKVVVQRKSEMNKFLGRKHSKTRTVTSTTMKSSQSFVQTTNDIRAKMREIVQKSNLIPLALQQEMKIFVLVFILLISPIELRRPAVDDENAIYELSDLLKDRYDDRHKHRPNPSYDVDQTNANDDDDNVYDNNNEDYLTPFRRTKTHPSHKKVPIENESDKEEIEPDEVTSRITSASKTTTTTTISQSDKSDPSVCTEKYDIKSEQLVKVKELTNGARMIRYVVVDIRTLPSGVTVKDSCMTSCCAQKSCDLAMLSEQPTHNGYKCYLFACNGSCILASHQDYTILTLKTNLIAEKLESISTSTIAAIDVSQKKSFFRETSVVIFLVFGLVSTIILLILLVCQCRRSRKRGLKFKNYSVDEDYLINGLYL
ncbi:hypothetical protein I4U23_002450 [Adineta vaga]|nr:hypothetical protein I4U23_002450 [Adineta vaga]